MPVIKFVKCESLLQHEEIEISRYKKLKKQIKRDKIQKNPIIVTPLTKNNYLVLDGAHRYQVIQNLGYESVLCQIVEEKDFHIDSWTHNLSSSDYSNISFFKNESNDLSGSNIVVKTTNGNIIYGLGDFIKDDNCLEVYKQLVEEINKKTSFERGVSMKETKFNVKYPKLNLQDIQKLVEDNKVLPAGVTKISINTGRVLCVNVPLSELVESNNDNSYLEGIEKKLRFYNEPIYLYEER